MSRTEELLADLTRLDAGLGDDLDVRAPATLAACRDAADEILARTHDGEELWALEQAGASSELGKLTLLAVKLARSRAFLLTAPALTVSVVIPAYSEVVRLMPRGTGEGQNPDGEDFVAQKGAQLGWLFAGTASRYDVVFVDDMSRPEPVPTGDAIAEAIAAQGVTDFRVVYLTDGVQHEKDGDPLVAAALRGVEIPKNTRKAGAVYYGVAKAIQAHGTGPEHIIWLTDCDLSVDLGQVGNLLAPIAVRGAVAAAGSRRLPESVLEIQPGRNTRANAARYFRELLLTGLLPRDTQCGAKAFAAHAVGQVIGSGMDVLDFSFDIELLTKLALAFGADRIEAVPVAWFDSSELTTTDSSVHHRIMQAQLAIALANDTGAGEGFDAAVAVARKLTGDEDVWLRFLDTLGEDPRLLRGIETFDPALLPELDRMADAAAARTT